MNRNFVLTKYYKNGTTKELHQKGAKAEYAIINEAMNDLIHDDIVCFKSEYNEPDNNNNQKVHHKLHYVLFFPLMLLLKLQLVR